MEIFFSNRIEKLYQQLKVSLFSKERLNPFERRLIIVPSPAIKSWLMLQMAKDPDLELAMGIEIVLLDQAVEKLISKRKIPSGLELSLKIEVEIKKIITESFNESSIWQSLFNYLKISDVKTTGLSQKSEKRLIGLSQKLASLFLQYGTYGGKMLKNFEESSDDFQVNLWKTIFLKNNTPFLQKELQDFFLNDNLINSPIHIHLFSLSFLSKIHYQFFLKIAHDIPVLYYFLSPCQAFWSDIKSDRERILLKKYLQKNGVSETQEMELDEYLRDQNPLLANFGRLGREMAKLIEDSEALVESCYVISEGIQDHEQYEEFVFDDFEAESGPLNLLKAVQADLSLLRNPCFNDKIQMDNNDRSIQLHIACSKPREIQILYDNLLTIIKNNNQDNSIALSNIIVMAPDIMDYEPFIHAVFGSKSSLLNYHVMDLHMPSKNILVQSFNHLLALPQNRFSAIALMEIFNGIHFQACHQLTAKDVDKIAKWLMEADLRWGHSPEDREELLTLDHCYEPLVEKSGVGTVNYCIDRLLASLAIVASSNEMLNTELERLPIQGVDATDADLLGKLTELIHSLRNDLKIFSDGTEMTIKNWASYLDCLAKAYFGIDETIDNLDSDELTLLQSFDEFRKVSRHFKTDLFSFNTIKIHLETAFSKERLDFQERQINSVRFCSMLPMRAVPASIVVLIGMNEGAFPRTEHDNSLDLTSKYECDYCPTKTDYDRYLFLEALLSARNYFILSYVGYSLREAKEVPSSLVITELVNILDQGYLIGTDKFSEINIKKHPFKAYDRQYFEKDSGFISYSSYNYNIALKFYNHTKNPKNSFIPDFAPELTETSVLPEIVIDLKELSNFAKNPLKAYFNKTLGIYLKNHEPDFKSDEDFTVSHLDFAIIKKLALKEPLKELLNLMDKKGQMPSGLFKKVTHAKLDSDIDQLHENLKKLNIQSQDIFTIDFFENCKEPIQDETGNFQLPPLEIHYQNKTRIKIVGTLHDVSYQGLILHAKDSKVDIVKYWPQYLVFSCLMKQHNIAKPDLIFAKCGKCKSAIELCEKYLGDYLDYYFKGLQNPSPLIPEWVYDFVYQKDDSLAIKIKNSLDNDFNPIFNDYLHWMKHDADFPAVPSFREEWKEESRKLFFEMYEQWYAK
jgi:exodeoxyribonuclease V gamma subunit